jgi:hypothetical protein
VVVAGVAVVIIGGLILLFRRSFAAFGHRSAEKGLGPTPSPRYELAVAYVIGAAFVILGIVIVVLAAR